MNTVARKESLPAVTAAGVIAILFGVLGALGSLLGGLSLLLAPQLETTPHGQAMPPGVRVMSAVMMLVMLGIAIFGIFVGVGILRRRNWARISILVWGGFMTVVSLGAIAFSLLILGAIQPQLPSANPEEAAKIAQFIKVFLVVFYGLPACVGIWWLILFTRKRVGAAFTNPAEYHGGPIDASGFPQSSVIESPRKPQPACPLPIAIFSVFLIFSALLSLVFLLMPLPMNFPLFLFGHVFTGSTPRWILGLIGIASGAAGFGMLKLKPWAFYTELAIQCAFLASALVTAFSPGFVPAMRAAMQGMFAENPAFSAGNPFLTDNYIRWSIGFGVVLCAAFVALLMFQRTRFLETAAEAD